MSIKNSDISLFVSVIIPVFNHGELLKICLEALENQTYPHELYEVIVIDNGSEESQNIKGIVSLFSQAYLTNESHPGSYAARNQGLSLAKGNIIAFTDADCIPLPNWIEKGVRNVLAVSDCGLVVGKITIFFKNSQQPTPIELYESITAFPQKQLLENHQFGATANVFTRREVIEKVGYFNENLKSRGDVEWGKRVFAHGYQQIYVEDVCVLHPARYSWGQLYRRTIRLAGGIYDLQRLNNPSLFKQNLLFLRDLILDFIPPLMFTFNAFLDPRLPRFEQKLQVSLVMFFVRYVTAWEKLKLKAGFPSAR